MRKTKSKELTEREIEILSLLAGDKTIKAIAAQLGIARETLDVHRHNIMKKLGVHTRDDLGAHVVNPKEITPSVDHMVSSFDVRALKDLKGFQRSLMLHFGAVEDGKSVEYEAAAEAFDVPVAIVEGQVKNLFNILGVKSGREFLIAAQVLAALEPYSG